MKKAGAVSILTTMLMGFFAWAALAIVENKVNISRVDQKEINSKELLKEMRESQKVIRADIKTLLKRSK